MDRIIFEGQRVELQAAAGKGPKTFSGVAYTGGQMEVGMYYRPVVIDLAGLKAVADSTPILMHHDPAQIVGHGDVEISARRVKVAGKISGGGEAAREVEASAANGFPWRLSVGVSPKSREFVDEGATATANGRTWKGPVNIIRAGELAEVSFVPIAADAKTSVSIAASGGRKAAVTMDFEKWLQANGWEPDKLTESQRTSLKAAYLAEVGDGGGTATATAAEDLRAEASRLAGIRAACSQHPEIEARAIDKGWTREQAELAVLRAGRSQPPATGSPGRRQHDVTGEALEAALMVHLGAGDIAERAYDERTLQCASDLRVRHCMDILDHGLRAAHVEPRGSRTEMIRAAFSTADLSGLLGNTANKILLDQYRRAPSVAKKIAKKLSAANFKQHTGYRLTGHDTLMSELGAGGQIEHGVLGEASYTFSIDTYAKMFAITRQDIINDDLGALNEIPRLIARGAALKLESLFWTLVLANTGDFFGTGNGNYISGADTALDGDSLGVAVKTLRKLVDAEGEPLMVEPKSLVVPPELETTADGLYASKNIALAGDTDIEKPDANAHKGKYKPEVVPYLSNSNYTGYSTTAWYLFADPNDTPAFGIAYLSGVETPTVESAQTDFNTLGMQYRGYFDLGVCQIDAKGGVKAAGA